MLIEFDKLKKNIIPNFKDGEGDFCIREHNDLLTKFAIGKLEPGASIGVHSHPDSCEIIYVLSGTGQATHNGVTELLRPGVCHYCPKGHSHSLLNDSDDTLTFFLVVPKQ